MFESHVKSIPIQRLVQAVTLLGVFFLASCGEKKQDTPSKNNTQSNVASTSMAASDMAAKHAKVTPPKPRASSNIVIPEEAIGWGWLPKSQGARMINGWSGKTNTQPTQLFFVVLVTGEGTLSPIIYTPNQMGSGGITIGNEVLYPMSPLPKGKQKKIRFNPDEPQALFTFTRKGADGFLEKWPRLKKLGIGKISVVAKKDKITVLFRSRKKKIQNDFRNALTYWHQLALSARTSIHNLGSYGPEVAKALVKASFSVKPSRIGYSITLSIEAFGWALAQLSRLYPVLATDNPSIPVKKAGPK
ncbi:hypothetical protein KJ865_04290 [Myxococcota bacterium]|nr:hypothetical protein [Myxococcota bacterium]